MSVLVLFVLHSLITSLLSFTTSTWPISPLFTNFHTFIIPSRKPIFLSKFPAKDKRVYLTINGLELLIIFSFQMVAWSTCVVIICSLLYRFIHFHNYIIFEAFSKLATKKENSKFTNETSITILFSCAIIFSHINSCLHFQFFST